MPIDFETLRDHINKVWNDTYGGNDPVEDVKRLCNRVTYLADDRNCWVFNTKMAEKEAARLRSLP